MAVFAHKACVGRSSWKIRRFALLLESHQVHSAFCRWRTWNLTSRSYSFAAAPATGLVVSPLNLADINALSVHVVERTHCPQMSHRLDDLIDGEVHFFLCCPPPEGETDG